MIVRTSVRPSVRTYVRQSVRSFIRPSIHYIRPSICLTVRPFCIRPPVRPSVRPFVRSSIPYFRTSICLTVRPSVYVLPFVQLCHPYVMSLVQLRPSLTLHQSKRPSEILPSTSKQHKSLRKYHTLVSRCPAGRAPTGMSAEMERRQAALPRRQNGIRLDGNSQLLCKYHNI